MLCAQENEVNPGLRRTTTSRSHTNVQALTNPEIRLAYKPAH